MKVLWFANTPCGATECLTGNKVTGGGWLYALSEALSSLSEIELHIAFYWHDGKAPFVYKGIVYHPILREGIGNKWKRYLTRVKRQFSSSIETRELGRLCRVIDAVNPDIIHIHGSEENYGCVARMIDNQNIVLSIQGLLSPYFLKMYAGYARENILKYERFLPKLMLDGYIAQERIFRKRALYEREMFSSINHIIGRTDWDRDCSLAMNPNRKYYVCNEILRPCFFEKRWVVNENNHCISLVTTISSGLYKGLEMVYFTAQLLKAQHINFEWNVIGVSSIDEIARLTRKITDINPEEYNIHLLGRKNAEDILNILIGNHIFIQTSHIENSPNSLCEAMVLGMPIIASYAGGTSSMLEDGKEGVLVQDGDPYRLAGAVLNMIRNYKESIMMGEAARKRAIVRHNPKNVVEELYSIYQSLCTK